MKDPQDQQKDPTSNTLSNALSEIEELVDTVAQQFVSHPGFMWASGGFEILHADWPAYPRGHGVSVSIRAMTEFPLGTGFFPIDNIDQCTLFVVGVRPETDQYGPHHIHVALWDEDLQTCQDSGYIDGVRFNGNNIEFPKNCVELTRKGVERATIDMLVEHDLEAFDQNVADHLYEGHYDSAVREASICVELSLRKASGLTDHGHRLVEKCFGEGGILVPNRLPNASRQTLRGMFKAYFKFVRNDYAHDLPPVNMLTACKLVRRSAELIRVVQTATEARETGG